MINKLEDLHMVNERSHVESIKGLQDKWLSLCEVNQEHNVVDKLQNRVMVGKKVEELTAKIARLTSRVSIEVLLLQQLRLAVEDYNGLLLQKLISKPETPLSESILIKLPTDKKKKYCF